MLVDRPQPRGTVTFWSAYARVYDLAWDSPLTRQVAARVAEHLDPGPRTVDLGCGTGLIAGVLGERGHRVIGVDSSATMIARARLLSRVESATVAPAHRTGLASGSASAVAAVNLLHVVPDPAAVVDEAVRLSTPGGRLALVWPTDEVDPRRLRSVEAGLGWGAGRSGLAALARSGVAVPGILLGVRKHSSPRLVEVCREAARRHGLRVVADEVYRGCQRLVVLEKQHAPGILNV